MSTWADVIGTQAAYVAELEQLLRDDAWDTVPTVPAAPALPAAGENAAGDSALGAPGPQQLAALHDLVRRRTNLLHELAREQVATSRQLGELSARRTAGRSYAAH